LEFIMKRREILLLSLIGGTLSMAAAAPAAIVVNIANGGSSTVTVGQTIDVQILVSTDNPDGIHDIQARVQESTSGYWSSGNNNVDPGTGTGTDLSYAANVFTNQSITNTTSNHADVSSFNNAFFVATNPLGDPVGHTLESPTSKYSPTTLAPTSPTGNSPLAGFQAFTAGDASFDIGDGFSSGNAVQTKLIDISYKAQNPGTVYFSITNQNGDLAGAEWGDNDGGSFAPATVTAGSGFSVNIVPAPEPLSLGLMSMSVLGLLRRRT
jgi:hypothetical protein